MHFGGLPQKAIDDLILVFLHAHGGQSFQNQIALFFRPLIDLLDNLTSNLSTFPYTATQCEKFLELLNMSRGTTIPLVKKKKSGTMF